jgi:response regulator
MMNKILIVEDDELIAHLVKKNLEKWGYEATIVIDFDQILQTFSQYKPHLVLMDITLPFFNGYYWTQEIRKVSTIPIIFLSSHDQAMDIVMAINMGADDYLTKPFEMSVLLAKVAGLLRRSYEFNGEMNLLEYEGIMLDLKAMTVHYQGESQTLSKNEFQILRVLFEQSRSVVSRDTLMQELWNSEVFIDDNTLSVNVARLRKRLGEMGLEGLILTKKGVGYMLGKGQ